MSVRLLLAALLLPALLVTAGCGGTDDVASPPAPDVPVTSGEPVAGRSADVATGVVRDVAGGPVAGVLVAAVSLDTPPQPVPEVAVSTGTDGAYAWPAVLRPGRYELRASTPDGTAVAPLVVGDTPVRVDLRVPG